MSRCERSKPLLSLGQEQNTTARSDVARDRLYSTFKVDRPGGWTSISVIVRYFRPVSPLFVVIGVLPRKVRNIDSSYREHCLRGGRYIQLPRVQLFSYIIPTEQRGVVCATKKDVTCLYTYIVEKNSRLLYPCLYVVSCGDCKSGLICERSVADIHVYS